MAPLVVLDLYSDEQNVSAGVDIVKHFCGDKFRCQVRAAALHHKNYYLIILFSRGIS
jgi:hypothetical protein